VVEAAMTTISKFYFHDPTTGVSGTLPGSAVLSSNYPSPAYTASNCYVNRTMDASPGATMLGSSATTTATKTFQYGFHRRFCSDLIAAQTISFSYGSQHIHWAGVQSSTNVAGGFAFAGFVWRPGTGSIVGTLFDVTIYASLAANINIQALSDGSGSASGSVTTADGDIIIIEYFSRAQQSMASSYQIMGYYDGTTEDSTESNAAYYAPESAVTMYSAATTADDFPYVGGGYYGQQGFAALPDRLRRLWQGWSLRPGGLVVPDSL